tara:strand:- start:662 stop:811 length:150 start_codon:yes stop_codon:yes gene_type:complete
MTLKEKIKKLEYKIQQAIWGLQMSDYATPITTDDLDRMRKEYKILKNKL